MKKLRLISFLLLMLWSGSATSQNSLSITLGSAWNYDTAAINDNLSVFILITNTGNNQFNEMTWVYVDIYNPGQQNVNIDSTYGGGLNLAPNDTSGASLSWIADGLKYVPGNNITVIWPSAPNTEYDSLVLNTYIDTSSGIISHKVMALNMYPNPVIDMLYLDNGDLKEIEYVRIYTLDGRIVDDPKPSSNIKVSNLTPGTYVINLFSKDGIRSSGMFIKTE